MHSPFCRHCLPPLMVVGLLAACGGVEPTFHAERVPQRLSEWGMLERSDGELRPATGVLPYDLNTALFSDYAHKLRTVWMPEGTAAAWDDTATFDFPVGTVITKTFFYPAAGGGPERVAQTLAAAGGTGSVRLGDHRLMETRVLAHRANGWISLPYIWNDDQTEAILDVVGGDADLVLVDSAAEDPRADLPFRYIVPDANQCSGCHATNHTTRAILPIGPKARHLNRDFAYTDGTANQLRRWVEVGFLADAPAELDTAPRTAPWNGDADALPGLTSDPERLAAVARGYLDINCSHCHNEVGPADTSALFLEPATTNPFRLGVCKPPVAAGRGTGDRLYAIFPGRPDESILPHRMNSVDPAVAMPELGRSTIHHEGVELLSAWIAGLEGEC